MLSRTARSCVQVALARPNHGGRHSKNGDSKWTKISDAYAVPDDVYDKIFLPEPPDIMLLAGEVNTNLTDLLFGLEEGGGGWSNASRAGGKSSTVTGDITWRLRCKSHNAYKCPAAVQLVLRVPDRAMHLEHAVGWLHNHSGELHTSVGLPPSVKVIIDNIISSHPGIKCASVKNQLWENYNVSKEMFESKVETYFYKGCAVRRKSLDVSTGISSFGAAQAFCESHQLFDVLPNHTVGLNSGYLDVPGVVGHYLDTSKDRCVIQLGTVKTLLDTWLQSTFGYGGGQLHADFTFKMLQEQIPFAVTSVPDLQQHVHLSTLGPCTHQDADMMRLIFNAIKVSIEKLVRMIIAHDTPNSCWPSNWPPALIIELVDSYKDLIIAGLKQSGIDYYAGLDLDKDITYEPGGIMADAADAIGNGARAVWPDVNVRMCWPHVWRAVKGNHWRLKKNTEQQQRTLYEDLNFIHELTVPELVPIAMAKFYAKWRKMGEGAMVNYIKNEWEARNWTRADGEAGEPGDNNTLESLNRGLKSDPSFAKTTSLGLCLKSCLTVVHRYSRDAKPLASIDAPVVKKETWVKAQKLNDTSFFKMGYKMDNKIVIPSSKLLDACPGKSVAERRQNMSVWVKEYVSLMKNPGGYYKLHGAQSWDFDTLIDYAYSFYVIEPIDPSVHRHYGALASAGIMYKCNCPQFMHYYNCKHAVGYALYTNGVHAPTVFSTKTVGKRKAPAGAKSGKRSHCLAIDN